MPMMIRYIDEIAREKNRDVLYLSINPKFIRNDGFEIDEIPIRNSLLAWFEEQKIDVEWCGPMSNSMQIDRYKGDFYINVPYEENDPTYKKVQKYLEDKDGNMKSKFCDGVRFIYITLDIAKEAYNDDPDFWDVL